MPMNTLGTYGTAVEGSRPEFSFLTRRIAHSGDVGTSLAYAPAASWEGTSGDQINGSPQPTCTGRLQMRRFYAHVLQAFARPSECIPAGCLDFMTPQRVSCSRFNLCWSHFMRGSPTTRATHDQPFRRRKTQTWNSVHRTAHTTNTPSLHSQEADHASPQAVPFHPILSLNLLVSPPGYWL